jgi:hypothetical protein
MTRKIFLGSLVHDCKMYCLPSWLMNLEEFKDQCCKIVLVNNSESEKFNHFLESYSATFTLLRSIGRNIFERIGRSRRVLFEEFLKSDCDLFFSLECDVFCSRKVIPILEKYDVNVVGVPYILGYLNDSKTRLKIDYIMSAMSDSRINYTFGELLRLPNEYGLTRVNESGLGCILIDRHTIESILERFTISDYDSDDKQFYRAVRELCIPVMVDCGLINEVNHFPHFHKDYAMYEKKHEGTCKHD